MLEIVFILVNYYTNYGSIISKHWACDNFTFEQANIDLLALMKLDLGSLIIFSNFEFFDPSAIPLTYSNKNITICSILLFCK